METLVQAVQAKTFSRRKLYLPREHGATAMLLSPIFCAAILARTWHWSELAVLVAAFAALSAKDPAVLLIRQRFLWKQRNPDSSAASQWLSGWSMVLIVSVLVLLATWPLKFFVAMGSGIATFGCLAMIVNLKNRQRSTLFQIASAAALTSTSLATCMSSGGINPILVLVVLGPDRIAGKRGNPGSPCPAGCPDCAPQGRCGEPAISSRGPGHCGIAPVCGFPPQRSSGVAGSPWLWCSLSSATPMTLCDRRNLFLSRCR